MVVSQLALDWNRDVSLPVSGRSSAAKHASATGAMVAARSRTGFALEYRRLLIESGPLSDDEAAKATGRRLSSICSTRNGWQGHVIPSGVFEATEFGTKRVRWQWRELVPRCSAKDKGHRCSREDGHDGLHDCGWTFGDEPSEVRHEVTNLRTQTGPTGSGLHAGGNGDGRRGVGVRRS